MAGAHWRAGRTLAIVGVAAASLLATGAATADEPPLGVDPYLQGRCPGDDGRGFKPHFNPKVDAWPVYQPSDCYSEPAAQPEEPASSTTGSSSPAAEPAVRKRRRVRCAKRHGRAGRRCAAKRRAPRPRAR